MRILKLCNYGSSSSSSVYVLHLRFVWRHDDLSGGSFFTNRNAAKLLVLSGRPVLTQSHAKQDVRETQVLSFVLPPTTQTFLLSPSPAVSPAFANLKKVYVPYYISDEHSGHFYFLRRNIVSGVVGDIYWKGMIKQSGRKNWCCQEHLLEIREQ